MRHWSDAFDMVRFRNRGRDWSGVDCWGLIHLVYREVLGIEIPAYAEVSVRDVLAVAQHMEADSLLPPWQFVVPAGQQRAFDVVVMEGIRRVGRPREPGHVGIMTSAGEFMHIDIDTDVERARLTDSRYKRKIIKICRHEALTCSIPRPRGSFDRSAPSTRSPSAR